MMRAMTTEVGIARTDRRGVGALLPSAYSVRTRITATVALLVALALTASGLLVYALGTERAGDTVRAAVAQELAELEEFEENGVDPQTGAPFASVERLVQEFLERNVPSSSELLLGVWEGQVRKASASGRGGLREDPAFLRRVLALVDEGGSGQVGTRWGEVYFEVLPLRDAELAGAFVVAFFVDDELAPLQRLMRTYALTAVLALLTVTTLAAWQAGRLLAPIRTLRRTADEITETDLSRRIPEAGNDDLTDLTVTVNAMLERLESAFQGQRAFLDDAGHELRTPLTILRGHLELLDAGDAEEVERTRDLLLDEVDRMARLVEDMILLAKAERPGFLSPGPSRVDELVASVADKVSGLGDRDWQVEARTTAVVDLDVQRVTQALVQLAHNAVKHTAPGDTVALGAEDTVDGSGDGAVHLWVRDTGPGVPDAEKALVFERFARGRDVTDDGAGLGLSIVAAIAQAHGGSVQVEDALPHGARFVITLPRVRKEPPWPGS